MRIGSLVDEQVRAGGGGGTGALQVRLANLGLDGGEEEVRSASLALSAAGWREFNIVEVAVDSVVTPDLEDQIGASGEGGVDLDGVEGLAGDGEENVRGQSLIVRERKWLVSLIVSSSGEGDLIVEGLEEARSDQVALRLVDLLNGLRHLVVVS